MMANAIDVLSRARSVPTDAPLALWLLDLSGPPPSHAIGWLSDEELLRAARFAFPRHRDRYLNAHIALRALLEEHCGLPPHRQHFVSGPNGKPQLSNLVSWQFSLSYAEDVALMAIDFDNHVGVDIERDRTVPDADDLSALHFHPQEQRALARLPRLFRNGPGFLRGWTRKEACLKALGHGLTMPAAQLHSGLTGRRKIQIGSDIVMEVGCCAPLAGFIAAWARTIGHPPSSTSFFQ
jgi:4'-phosphopantetheinyl transferase